MNNDLISRSALLKEVRRSFDAFIHDAHFKAARDALSAKRAVICMINDAPAVDTVVVRHGRWIDMQEDDATEGMWRCSACGFDGYFDILTPEEWGTNYCPNCGAKMNAEVE